MQPFVGQKSVVIEFNRFLKHENDLLNISSVPKRGCNFEVVKSTGRL